MGTKHLELEYNNVGSWKWVISDSAPKNVGAVLNAVISPLLRTHLCRRTARVPVVFDSGYLIFDI